MKTFFLNRLGVKTKWIAALTFSLALVLVGSFLLFLFLDYLYPFPTENLNKESTIIISDKEGDPLRFFFPKDKQWRFPVELKDIDPKLVSAVIESEDRWFYTHPGVNPLAIGRAFYTNIKSGQVVSGASTIPMQIARLSEPKNRTVFAKANEAFRALQLKWHYDDNELLKIYLNIAPYGGNIEGVGAASYFYFGKSPRALEPHEIALLTLLPRSPTKYDPTRNPKIAHAKRNEVINMLKSRGVFTSKQALSALEKPVPSKRKSQPFKAPHFTEFVYKQFNNSENIQTTLDIWIQHLSDSIAKKHIGDLRSQGINNLAIVVIDNESRELRAMIGSSDFFERSSSGQVNNAVSRRSPGSALKPFLYALALDQGLVIPDTYMLDIPTDFSGYVAENYDDKYRGPITMRNALILSLNAPAVRLLSRVGLKDFHDLLLRGGLKTLDRPTNSYGLPLVLGSGEVTLLDLTNLYATLAEGGVHRAVKFVSGPGHNSIEAELITPEASYLITEILTELKRPDMPSRGWALTKDVPEVAWKTGTSYGHRDAWSIGYSDRYTIGVWVGNPDGRGVKGISGAEHAGPILFDLFRAIEGGGSKVAEPTNLNLRSIEVCKQSHMLPSSYCAQREKVTYIPGVSKLSKDNYSKRIFIDKETGHQLIGECLSERPHEARVFTVYPPELTAWWRVQGKPLENVPPVSSHCKDIPPELPPTITSPDQKTPYRVLKGTPSDYQKIRLSARVSEEVETLYWYQDGKLIATTSPDKKVFMPLKAGIHNLVVVDSSGRMDSISYSVESSENPEFAEN